MGNCGSLYTLNYCQKVDGEPLNADPDIVGPGVLAGFALTAIFTIVAIIIGYFTDSLPDDYTKNSDTLFLDWVNGVELPPRVRRLGSRLNSLIRKVPLLRKERGSKKSLSKEQRQQMLENFILALSDQQLVTGIAVLVASFSAHCRISAYELNLAISLAWFSSATHLATLDVLQNYLRRNKVVRNLRMVGMIGIVLLLIPGLILGTIYPSNASVPIQCFQILPNEGPFLNPFGIIAIGFTVVYLIQGYVNRLSRTFASGASISITRLSLIGLVRFIKRLDAKDSVNVVDEAIKIQAQKYQKLLRRRAPSDTEPILARKVFMFLICSDEYAETFVQKLGSMGFMLSYGLSQVATYRWLDDPPQLDPTSNRMDFGQIVPLVLLIIPILTAAEILYESPEEAKQQSKKDLVSISSGKNSDELSNRRSPRSGTLPPPSPDVVATTDWSGHVTATAGAADGSNLATINNHALPLDIHTRGSSDSANLEISTHSETSTDHQEVLSSGRAIGRMFIFKTIINIGTGVSLNLTNFGIVFGALGMALIFGPDWFAWVVRLCMTVKAIFVVCRDEKFAPHSAIPCGDGQSTEMRTPPHHSSQNQQGFNTHAASPPLSAPRSRGSEYRVVAYPDADEPDLAPPRRQDTEARIGTNSSLPSIAITRTGTAGLSEDMHMHP